MKTFSQLTRRGQSQRLLELAREIVETDYEFANADVSLLSMHSFNTMFRVRHNGQRAVLRVGDACRIHVAGVEDVEADWLDSLHADGIPCPVIVRTTDGRNWVRRGRPDIGEPRVSSMFTWVDGRPLRERLTPERMRAAGRLLAEIHDQAARYQAPSPIPRALYANRVVYFHEENRLLTYESDYGSLLVEAIDRVQEHLNRLWRDPPHEPHLLHGDFGLGNVLASRSRLSAIDFQDLQYGFDLQDVAITLADLRRSAPEMIEPVRSGYAEVRRWPDLTPDLDAALTAARSLNIMNLGLHLQRSGFAQRFDEHATRVAEWMADATFDQTLDSVLIGGREAIAVEIAPYDPAWPARYDEHRATIEQALAPRAVTIHHVGSTAVEGLAAKPIVDIIVDGIDPADEDSYRDALEQAGYELRVREDDHLMFRTPSRDVHIHIWADPADVRRHLAFRDHLRASPTDREAYERLKRDLAEHDWPDMNYYARAKGAFIEDVVARADAD